MSWIKRILGSDQIVPDIPSPSTGFFDLEGHPVPISLNAQDMRSARELVRASAVSVASAYGIPSNWLSYEVVTISDDEKAYFQLQIGLRHWDEQLWNQTSAFEQQAIKRIREENAQVARAVRAVLWRILPDAGCPHDELSPAMAWKPDAVKSRGVAYERLRHELTLPSIATIPSVVSELSPTVTAPDTQPVQSNFVNTYPGHHAGFDATRPFMPDDDRSAQDKTT
ncbi:MAG: hypothetical protein HC858_09410 [Brachymonas sp.]|nr:hypothetical protein [Brachymonas sp.]